MTRTRITNPQCRHSPTGRVAWPTGMPEPGQLHASTYCCDRTECRDDAAAWVESVTRVRGVFVPFEPAALARVSQPVTLQPTLFDLPREGQ